MVAMKRGRTDGYGRLVIPLPQSRTDRNRGHLTGHLTSHVWVCGNGHVVGVVGGGSCCRGGRGHAIARANGMGSGRHVAVTREACVGGNRRSQAGEMIDTFETISSARRGDRRVDTARTYTSGFGFTFVFIFIQSGLPNFQCQHWTNFSFFSFVSK